MIDALITGLSKGLELSAEEIADTLWLALQIEESQPELSVRAELRENPPQPTLAQGETEVLPEISTHPSELEETESYQPPNEPKAGIYPRNPHESLVGSGLSLRVPDAPSLREPLTLARALKPLMRRMPSGSTLVLDEAATTQQIAETGLWLPVLKPTLEPWLDLELVVDEGISMQIWRQTIGELERLLKNYGIFRDVRVWGLIADDSEASDLPRLVQIRRGIGATAKHQSPRSPAELIDPSGRRLILVVSDCVSPQWRDGKLTTTLELWAKQGSMAIVQMLPKWLWKRTALGRAAEVRLQGLNPGEFNQKLIAKGVSLWDELDETRGVKIPIFTLEPDRVATWAQMLSGRGSIWTAGYVFKLDPLPVRQGKDLFNLDTDRQSAEQRVQAFRVTASPMARKLAGLLAAAPVISLPIVRLIQETLLKESQQVHVAEVFLGGLLKPLSEINPETNPNYVQYEFIDGVRELLADSVPLGYQGDIFDAVSKYMARKMGLSLEEFAAVLRNPQQVLDGEMASEVEYFATMTPHILRQWGGKYMKFAEELERNHRQRYQNNSQAILNPLPDIEYRVGGSLHPDSSSYVKRKADDELFNLVKTGHFCIVSTPRQTGKSSLMLQTIKRLKEEKFACALIDVSTIITSDFTQEKWYAGLIHSLTRRFELGEDFDLKSWWQQLSHLSPAHRFIEFIEEILLQQISECVVIFIDEIDSILMFDFKQDFFTMLRGLHQNRVREKDINRLNFVLLGLLLDTSIPSNINISPLPNIATKIYLESFSYEEALPLAGGLAGRTNNPQELLREILAWTGGQPFLTQKICLLVKESGTYVPEGNEKAWLENLVITQVIDRWQEQDRPEHLLTIQNMIFHEDPNELLRLYRSILQEYEYFSARNKLIEKLILIGLVVRSKAKLKVANRIYSAIFNLEWIEEKLGNSINSVLQIVASNDIKQTFNPNDIIQRILNGISNDADIEDLRQWFESGGIENFQAAKYNVNIEQGQDIHIGDRIYQGFEAETIKEIFDSVLKDHEVYISHQSNHKNIANPDRMPSLKIQQTNKSVKPQRRPNKSNLEKTIQISNNINVLCNLRSTDKAKTNALKILGRVANGNDRAIRWIIVLIGRERNNTIIAEAIETLSKIGKDKPSVITAISRLLTPDLNSLAIIDAMRSIIKRIANNNEILIQKMLNLLEKGDSKIKTSIVITMGEVEVGTRIAIDRLLSELGSKKNLLTLRKEVAKSLGKVAKGDKKVVVEMERIARFERNKYLKDCIMANSKKINI
jgi:AAA-like domain/Effector-associated domain 10